MAFDIEADISLQFTLDGSKIIHIYDSKLNVPFPIAIWIENVINCHNVNRQGTFLDDGQAHKFDIVTKPKPKPLIVSYNDFYIDGVSNPYEFFTEEQNDLTDKIATIKTIYNPNNNQVFSEVVYFKN